MKTEQRRYALAAFWGGFLLLLCIAFAATWFTIRREAVETEVNETLETIDCLNRVLYLAADAESGQRGYLLTGRPEYLLPYGKARQNVETELARLDKAFSKNFGTDRTQVLRRLIGQKLDELKRTIDLRQAGRASEALTIVNNDVGMQLMTEIRAQTDALYATQVAYLKDRLAHRRLLQAYVQILLMMIILVILGLAAATIKTTRDRLQALEDANHQLKAEAAAREVAETQVRQLQKMEAVGQLTGGIAHDFNNLLAVIIGSLDMALRRIDSKTEARVAPLIQNGVEAASRAATLTSRLLAFSRQTPLVPAVVDANRLVSGMSELLRRTLGVLGDHIQIETVLAGGLWSTFVDPMQLENAVLNLAVNARDAMPKGGKLTIETYNADLDERYAALHREVDAGQYVLISLTDSGVGMPPDVVERAFEPFFTTKSVGKGTGLGLSQVYGFVKQSRGHIKIYSELGRGTTIKLYLPRYRGEPARLDLPTFSETPLGSPQEVLLVVEDDHQVRQMTVEMCRQLRYHVVAADAPEVALRFLEHSEATLLLTDVVMPGMDGRILSERAKALRPNIKVLFTTGYTRNAIIHNGIVDPDKAFIAKPFDLAQLARKLREVLGEQSEQA
jgi:signal transduction histidine kinase/CheY-like chemotaxis protein